MKALSINTLLEYTPYDNKCPSPFGRRINEETEENKFYDNELFVPYPSTCSKLYNELKDSIEDESTHSIVFSGASGSGKTTFLKDYFRNNKDNYICQYINLLDNPTTLIDEDCIRTSLLHLMEDVFSKDVASFLYQTYCEQKVSGGLARYDLSFMGNKLSRFIAFCNTYSQNESNLNFHAEIRRFDIGVIQLLSLFVIINVIANKDRLKPMVFVFDNLDEIDKQYINTKLNEMVLSSFSIAQGYSNSILQFDYVKYVTFIFSFRSENETIFKNTEAGERYKVLHNVSIEFSPEYQVKYDEILKTRIQYYERAIKEMDEEDRATIDDEEIKLKEKYANLMDVIRSEDSYFKRFIAPLYSYDYRMFTHFALKKSLRNRTVTVHDAVKQKEKSPDSQQGARGMLLFYALAGMLSDDKSRFSSYTKEEFSDDTCNIFRMSFTLLSKMCGWSHQNAKLLDVLKDEADFNERTQPVNLLSFLKVIRSWYADNDTIFVSKVLDGMIGSTARSYECPITLTGSTIDGIINSLGQNFSVSELATKIIKAYLEDTNSLTTVSIKVNPLCVVYATRVFIHYEYFNLISTQWRREDSKKDKEKNEYSPRPLFHFTDVEKDKRNIELCLAVTFDTVKKIIDIADNHFCNKCKYEHNQECTRNCVGFIKSFIDEGLCFNDTIHATRVITAHVRYLEHYRTFLWYQVGNKKEHSEAEIVIQKMIINQIMEYIDYFSRRTIKDDKYGWISNYWRSQYANALKIIDLQPQYYSVIKFDDEMKTSKKEIDVN